MFYVEGGNVAHWQSMGKVLSSILSTKNQKQTFFPCEVLNSGIQISAQALLANTVLVLPHLWVQILITAIINNIFTIHGVQEYPTTLWQHGTNEETCPIILCCCWGLLRQGFSVWQPWLSWNLFCRPDWPQAQRPACLCLHTAGTKCMCHHIQLPCYIAKDTKV